MILEIFDQISNRTSKQEALTYQWPLESKSSAAKTPDEVPESEQNGALKTLSNLFVEGPSKGVSLQNGVKLDSESNMQFMSHEPITISPPPQSTKPGRGRRSVKVNNVQVINSDMHAVTEKLGEGIFSFLVLCNWLNSFTAHLLPFYLFCLL